MISCHQHDYIEIACLYRLRLCIELANGNIIEGIALDTGSRQGREWLKLAIDEGEVEFDLDQVQSLVALDNNPHFRSLELRK